MTSIFALLTIVFLLTATLFAYRGISRWFLDPFGGISKEYYLMIGCIFIGLAFAILFFLTLEH